MGAELEILVVVVMVPYLSDALKKSANYWDLRRSQTNDVEIMYWCADSDESKAAFALDWQKYAMRLKNCAYLLEFGMMPDEDGVVALKFKQGMFCQLRYCPLCTKRKSINWERRWDQAFPAIQAAHPKSRYLFLTLTIKNMPVENLNEGIKALNGGFRRLSRRKDWPGQGWIKKLEITRGKDGKAHPHLHCLVMVKSTYFHGNYYRRTDEWALIWKKCLKVHYVPVVDIRAVKPSAKRSHNDLSAAIAETLKYTIKPEDFLADYDFLCECTFQLHRSRSISLGGVFKKYLSEDEPDAAYEPDSENNPGGEFYRYSHSERRYKRHENYA